MSEIGAYSKTAIEKGSKSFSGAARLLAPECRDGAQKLYAWCRHCDDQIDSQQDGFPTPGNSKPAQSTLEALREDTRRAMAGEKMKHPAFVAFQQVVKQYAIPERYPLELIDGFAMDVDGHEFRTLEDTLLYSYHVAGVVGVMMAYIMGVKEGDALLRASDLGLAFQLTNISRDVMDDARMGRVYLPADWLAEAGVPAEEIQRPEHSGAVFQVVRRLLAEADKYYDSAIFGLPELGWRSAWGIATARYVYRHVGRLVLKRGPRAWDQRAVVGRGRKLFGATLGLATSLFVCSVGRLLPTGQQPDLWRKHSQEAV